MVTIREATTEDRDKVFDLLRQLMETATDESAVNQPRAVEVFREMVKGETGAVLLAEEDGEALGLVTLSYPMAIRCAGIYGSIEEFIVNEAARGKGVGGKLLEAAIAKAIKKGCHEPVVNRPSDLGYPVYVRHGIKDGGKSLLMQPVRSVLE